MSADRAAADILRNVYPRVGSSNASEYFAEVGSLYDALCYSWLFWPKLLEAHGAVFVGAYGWDEAELRQRIATPAGPEAEGCPELPWKEAVDSYNRIEIGLLFRQWPESFDYVESAIEELARVLVQVWSARLRAAYPERSFSVGFMDSDHVMEVGVEVTQDSPPLKSPRGWDPVRRFVDPDVL